MHPPPDSIRALHVDDDPEFVDLAASFLEREEGSFCVETATSVEEGLERLGDAAFDCVVSDYDMPGRTGIEFLEAVREIDPDLPFVLYTGKGSEEVASDAISAGVTDYLQKDRGTSQYTVLANRIRNAVDRHRVASQIERNQHRLEQILKTVPACIVQIDPDGQFVFANDRAETVLGLDPAAVTDRTYNDPRWEITDLEGNPIPDEELPFRKVLESGEPVYDQRHTVTWPDGTRKILSVQGAPLFDEAGEIKGTVFALMDVTDRQRRREELRRSTARLEALFEHSPDMIDVLDPDGRIRDVNRRFCTALGYDAEEILGTPIWEIDRTISEDEVASLLADLAVGERRKFEGTYERADGTTLPVEVHLLRLNLNDKDRYVGISRDITERRREQRKRERIIERVTDAIVEVDEDWAFTLVNEQAEELYDMAAGDLLGEDFWDVFAEAEGTRFEAEYRGVMEQREPTSFTAYYPGLEGWFDIEVYPKDDGGIAFYFREVSDRVERSRELERHEEQFQYVESVADIGYWEIDLETPHPHEVTLSEGVYAIHDLPPDEPMDPEKGMQFYHPEDRPAVRADLERAMAEGEPYDHEARIVTATGRERWVHSVGEPVERDGEVVAVRGVFQDITERKEKEQELARQNERLDAFASVVSHDLRNPLNVAGGRIDLAREECDSEHLGDAAAAIERSQELVEDVLTLAREGDAVGDTEPVSLPETVTGCWETISTGEADLAVDTNRTVLADRGALQRLLENLIGNAVEHGGSGVTVTVGAIDEGFYVADDGEGISADEPDRIFETGYSTVEDSTGFGLAIVTQIADAHDWEIGVTESEAGGARFEITDVEFA